MTLQERINNDLKSVIENREKNKINNLKLIVGELQRMPNKELNDEQVIGIIKKLIKYERENIDVKFSHIEGVLSCTSEYLKLLESYTPKQT